MMQQIDPVVIQEELARIKKRQEFLRVRGNAALALAWLSEHALSKASSGFRTPVGQVLQQDIRPMADATPNVEAVRPYIAKAYREHQDAIIQRAIEMAQADYSTVEDK